jgi:hypothetical protein
VGREEVIEPSRSKQSPEPCSEARGPADLLSAYTVREKRSKEKIEYCRNTKFGVEYILVRFYVFLKWFTVVSVWLSWFSPSVFFTQVFHPIVHHSLDHSHSPNSLVWNCV